MDAKERYSRQKSIVSSEKLEDLKCTVIGVGAIGRNVALQLTAIGVKHLQLIDFDTVEESNIASQGYLEEDLGMPKVEATARSCKRINSEIDIDVQDSRFKASSEVGPVVFCCVDSITTREFIFNALKQRVDLFIDARMSAEVLRVISVHNLESCDKYASTLFTEEEAFAGSCTAKSTIYCASIAAGFMLSSFTKWLREFPLDFDVNYNLLANEGSVE